MRKKDGSEFPPNTLHHIVCGIMRHLRDKSPSLDFFTETDFTQLKKNTGCRNEKAAKPRFGITKAAS